MQTMVSDMRWKSVTLTIIGVLLIGGCANLAEMSGPPSYVGPDEHDVNQSATFDMSFDDVWDRTIDWLAENNIPLDNVDRSSGLITSERTQADASGAFLDCGDIEGGSPSWERSHVRGTQNINIRVREKAERETEITANVFGSGRLVASTGSSTREFNSECVSTGALERYLFSYIAH